VHLYLIAGLASLLVQRRFDDDVEEVRAALGAVGIRLDERHADGPWACVIGRRVPA